VSCPQKCLLMGFDACRAAVRDTIAIAVKGQLFCPFQRASHRTQSEGDDQRLSRSWSRGATPREPARRYTRPARAPEPWCDSPHFYGRRISSELRPIRGRDCAYRTRVDNLRRHQLARPPGRHTDKVPASGLIFVRIPSPAADIKPAAFAWRAYPVLRLRGAGRCQRTELDPIRFCPLFESVQPGVRCRSGDSPRFHPG
jgi:hypothetical protein